MTCFEHEEWINRYLDGELNHSEQRRFERHLAGCQACQREMAQTRALFAVLEALQDAPAPAGLHAELMAGLSPQPAPRLTRWILIAQAGATLLLLGLAYPQLATWYRQLGAWFAPGWLSGRLAQVAAWGQDIWTSLVGVLRENWEWSWPLGFGLTWPQAIMIAMGLVGLWWLGNRLLLAPGPNQTGGTT